MGRRLIYLNYDCYRLGEHQRGQLCNDTNPTVLLKLGLRRLPYRAAWDLNISTSIDPCPLRARPATMAGPATPIPTWPFDVLRNGGTIQCLCLPNTTFCLPPARHRRAMSTARCSTFQSKCCVEPSRQQTESVGWLDQYPTLTTESLSFNHYGGCGFPIGLDLTAAASMLAPHNSTAT